MAQVTAEGNWKFGDNVQIPPLRSFDEFLASKARFEMPPYRDFARWNNRILSNLLYFQTNYFLIFLVLVAISAVMHGTDTLIGLTAIAVLGAAFMLALSTNATLTQARRDHALATLGLFVVASYYFVYSIGSVIIVLFTSAVPVLLILIHASIRLRNLKAKINHQFERIGLKKTLMSRFFELIGVDLLGI